MQIIPCWTKKLNLQCLFHCTYQDPHKCISTINILEKQVHVGDTLLILIKLITDEWTLEAASFIGMK